MKNPTLFKNDDDLSFVLLCSLKFVSTSSSIMLALKTRVLAVGHILIDESKDATASLSQDCAGLRTALIVSSE